MSSESLKKARAAKDLKRSMNEVSEMSIERSAEITDILYIEPKVYLVYRKIIDKYARKFISEDMTFIDSEDANKLEGVESRMICVVGDTKFMKTLNSAVKKYLADYKLWYSIPVGNVVLYVMHKIYKVIK